MPRLPKDKILDITRYMLVAEAAETLGVTPHSIRNLIYVGLLPAARFGYGSRGAWRILRSDFRNFIRARQKEARTFKNARFINKEPKQKRAVI